MEYQSADALSRNSRVLPSIGADPWLSNESMKHMILPLFLAFVSTVMADAPTCPVSGEKVGEMGPPVSIDYQGKKVSFCCDSCIAKFQKDPAKYLSKQQGK